MLRSLFAPFGPTPLPVEAHTALILIAFLALLVFQAWALAKTGAFDARSFGEAVGLIMAGGGVAAGGQAFLNRSRGGCPRPDNPDGGM